MTLELFDLALAMLEQRLRREGRTPAEIEAEVERWLGARPGAEHGDAAGRPIELPRR
jgi:hypothetical protein